MSEQTEVIDGETGEITEPQHATAEVVRYEPQAQIVRSVDMRSAATDSWTDVVAEVAKLADYVSKTDFVPKDLRGNAPAIAGAILYGREIGVPPMTALQGIHVIEGRPAQAAELMRARILQAGHEFVIDENSSSKCVVSGRRKGSERWQSTTWTLEDAKNAGLLRPSRSGKPTAWQTYPRQMLLARATTELARNVFADVIHGMRSVEELIDEIDTVTEYQPPAPAPQQTSTVQRQPRKTAAKKAEAKPEPASNQVPKEEAPAQPPARKRAPLPAKRTSPGAAGEAGTDQGDDPATPGPASQSVEDQQAEVRRLSEERRQLRDSRPDPAADHRPGGDDPSVGAEVTTGRETGPKITPQQRTVVIMHFNRLDVEDREERLLWTNSLLGYEPNTIKTSSDLRQSEAVKIIQTLERLKDRDQLDALLNGQDELVP